jgi:ADP-ribose pyrophosphatase
MIKKPDIISTTRVHTGWVKLDVQSLRVDGTNLTQAYDVVTVGDGVAVLPFLDERTVLLTRQYRHPVNASLVELIQGGMRRNELPEEAARRELLEETGYTSTMEYVTTIYPLPCLLNMRIHLLRARHLEKIADPVDNPLERIELVKMSYEQLYAEVMSGQHKDTAIRELVMYHRLKS